MQHPSAVPVPPVKHGYWLPPGPEGEWPPTKEEEEEEGEKMQANPAYLTIEMMSY